MVAKLYAFLANDQYWVREDLYRARLVGFTDLKVFSRPAIELKFEVTQRPYNRCTFRALMASPEDIEPADGLDFESVVVALGGNPREITRARDLQALVNRNCGIYVSVVTRPDGDHFNYIRKVLPPFRLSRPKSTSVGLRAV
ncbi:MAG: hypothetical protein ACYC1C_18495 [Chloroflexota bacterium]